VFNSDTGEYETEYYTTGHSAPLGFTLQSDIVTVTLGPGEAREITVSVTVDGDDFGRYEEVFTNGFFLDGYVFLTDSTGASTDLNMPFLGFSGDWDEVPVIILMEYEELFFSVKDFVVVRNISEIRCVLTDADGNKAAEKELENIKVLSYLHPDNLVAEFEDLPDGTYNVIIYAVPSASRSGEAQEYLLGEVTVDNTPPEIVDFSVNRNSDGSGTITVKMKTADTEYFLIEGASLKNRDYMDIYPVDGYDSVDEDGNYVYVLKEEELSGKRFIITAFDAAGYYDEAGTVSLLLRIFRYFESVILAYKLLWQYLLSD
jgi:hypothetical protein